MERRIIPWQVRREQVMHNGQEVHVAERYSIVKDEREVLCTVDITDIRKIQELMASWKDPYKTP